MKNIFYLLLTSTSLCASQAIIYDEDLSPYMGAYDLLALHGIVEYGVDYFGSDKPRDTTLRVWGRALEQIFIWTPYGKLTSVTQHEVFGHGYRLREFGVPVDGYSISTLSGSTHFRINEDFAFGKLGAITVAGLEAEAILAQKAKMQWIGSGCIDGRLSTVYTTSQQSLFWYTLITRLGDTSAGNDVCSYRDFLNDSYGDDVSIGELTTWAAFNWLDPMTFYAYFSWFYYIATGCDWVFPSIPITEGVTLLPNVRIGYAPYSPEAYLEGFFSIHGCPLYTYIKGGKRSVGAGFYSDDLFCNSWGALGFHFDTWYQNKFISSTTVADIDEGRTTGLSELKQKVFGVAASITGRLKLKGNVSLFGEIGGKTKGYLPGYQVDGGLVARVGFWYGGCE